jgi:hypothetical protein
MVNEPMRPNEQHTSSDMLDSLRQELQSLPLYKHAHWSLSLENQANYRVDAIGELVPDIGAPPIRWGIEIKMRNLEPREAELLGPRLSEIKEAECFDAVVVLAPYISDAAGEALGSRGIGYWDQSGNCRLMSGNLYIERRGFPNKFARKASVGTPFSRAGQRVVRALLDPEEVGRKWSLRELAQAAYPGISLGQTQALVKGLENWEYLSRTQDGVRVINPEKLLRDWVSDGKPMKVNKARYYTPLSQDVFRKQFKEAVRDLNLVSTACLASFSAAAELAPYVNQHRNFFHSLAEVAPLANVLKMQPVSGGENVIVFTGVDEGVFYGAGLQSQVVTCPVQTFVDLMRAGGRGPDAAEHLFEIILKPRYQR